MYRSIRLPRFVFVVAFALALTCAALCVQPSIQAPSWAFTLPAPADQVRAAWQRAQQVGVYDFGTTLVQTTYPAPTLLNVGRSSRRQTLYLAGRTNQPAQTMNVRLWVEGGSVLTTQQGVEVRVEGDRAYGRTIGQETWDEIDNFTDVFAPGGDPLAYLAGAKNVKRAAPDATSGVSRFTFDVDGPGFAVYLRDQMERYMRETGELPAGITLEVSEQYRGVTGAGEIWLDADQLPLRLTVHMVYPEQRNGERVEAEITTDFTNFERERLAATPSSDPLTWAAGHLDLPRTANGWHKLGIDTGLMGISLCMVGFLLTGRRSKRTYAIVIMALILSMVVTPVLQGHHVSAFYDRQAARQAAQAEEQEAYQAERDLQEELVTSTWNPNADPIANQRRSEPALSTVEGTVFQRFDASALQQTSAPDSDKDSDTLTYAQEIALGTDPEESDSDGDGLTDNVEVKAFSYNDEDWYSNPLEADTNNDGQMDGIECPQRVRETSTALSPDVACQDTDRDGTPDIFDRDDDGDGVPDRVDISSTTVMGAQSPFSRDNPFKLIVNSVQQDKPLVVEFQLRPTNADHLAYALNVLDWPSGDHEGQVQRQRDNDGTFASTMTAEQIAADPASGNGDVRLLPMLEIEMSGDPVPLPLTTPRISVEIAGDASGSLDLAQQGADVNLNFHLQGSASYAATIYGHTCTELDLLNRPPLIASQPNPAILTVHTFSDVTDGTAHTIASARLTELSDSKHAIVLKNDSSGATTCTDLGNVVNGPYPDQMVDPGPLRAYGISVRERDDKGTLLAYIPLSLIPDETGGSNVAFGARMVYQQNAGAWGTGHQVRVVWLVQALTDFCKPMPDSYQPAGVAPEARQSTWCADINNWDLNQPQVIQAYDETWHLTGLSVREDHGMDIGILFEDPDHDDNVDMDDRLWSVARGLERSFLSGRAADPITIANIKQRFDNQSNAGASDEARWGVPQDALRVYTYAFPNQDYLPAIPMTYTKQILNDHFVDVLGNARAAAPTLMFAREERSRNADLGDPANTQAGNLLSVNLGPDVQTLVTASWAPYRYQNGAWESYPIAEYLDLLGLRLQDLLRADPEFYDPADGTPEVLQIEAMLGQSYYLAYTRGPAQVIRSGETQMADVSAQLTDAEIFKIAMRSKGTAAGTKGIIAESGEGIFKALEARVAARAAQTTDAADAAKAATTSFKDKIKSIGRILSGKQSIKLSSLFTISRLKAVGKFAGMVMLGTAVCATAIGISYALGMGGSNTFTSVIGRAFTLLNATYQVYNIVKTMVEVYRAVKQLASGAKGLMGLVKTAAAKSGVIGLVVSVVAAVGFFVYAMISNNVQAFSVEFNSALAGVIAGLVVNILMFIIGLIPVYGWIIVAVIGLIDAAISVICLAITTATGTEFDPALDLPNFRLSFCGGINGLATEVIKWLFYSNNLMVQLDNPDRLTFIDIQKSLVKPEDGFVTGNALTIRPKFKNRIALKLPHWTDWKAWQYFWQYSEHYLRHSTFDYQLQTTPKDIHEKLWMGQMYNEWKYDGGYVNALAPGYLATLPNVSENIPLGAPGFNRPMDLYLAEGYVVPMQECWSPLSLYWVPIAICYVRPQGGTTHLNLGRGMAFDVFPRTLDEFYNLTAKDGGYSLAWAQSGDLAFPRLKDADGDGLLNKADGGSDPDDSKWDTDGDGLSDFFESQHGTSLQAADTDLDGVSDYDELIGETNPLQADSDRDGLTDKEELDGWAFVYAVDNGLPRAAWVTSDPNVRDTDGDTWSDLVEKYIGFNPRVATDPNILDLATTVNERRAPRLLLRFEETAGATTFTDISGGHTASCTGDACPLAGMDGRYGKGIAFDGADDVVQVGDAPAFKTPQFTLSVWFQWDGVGTNDIQFLTSKGYEAFELLTGGGGYSNGLSFIPAGHPATSLDAPNVIQPGWNHVAAVYTGNAAYIYHNGTLAASRTGITGGADLTANSAPLSIGKRGDGSYPFDGTIDEVLLFDQALSEAEVAALFTAAYNPDDLQVQPSDSLHYHATAENALTFQYARGLLDVALPGAFSSSLPTQRFDLRPGERATLDGDVQVSASAASGLYTMTQISGASVTDPRESSNLVELLLRFDEPAGATRFQDDSSLFSRTSATCSGASCPTAGAEGVLDRALTFDGVDDYVQLAKTPALQLGSATIAAWFRADPDVTGNQVILSDESNSSRYSYTLFVSSNDLYDLGFTFTTDDGRYYWIYSGSSWSSEGTVRDGKWHHAAVVRNDETKTVQLYVDGTLRKTMGYSGVIDQNNNPIWIGRLPVLGGVYPLKGAVDELHIYRRPLSEQEVQQLAASPTVKLNFETQFSDASSGESYWPDESGAGHNVSCSASGVIACPVAGSGVAGGRGLEITGEYQQVKTKASTDLVMGNRFTLSAWVHPRDLRDARQGIIGADVSSVIGLSAPFPRLEVQNRDIWFGFQDTSYAWREASFPNVLTIGTWNHLALSFDSGSAILYVNGQPAATRDFAGAVPRSDWFSSFAIGCLSPPDISSMLDYIPNRCLLNGRIDQVAVYKQALAARDVLGLYESSIVALHLPFDDAPGSTRFYNTVSSNNGLCSGTSCPESWHNSLMNQAAYFDGVDDVVQVADAPGLRLNRYTLSLWFKWDNFDSDQIQFLTGKGMGHVEIHTGGDAGKNGLRFIPAGGSTILDAPNIIQPGWNHIVFVYVRGSHAGVYRNGELFQYYANLPPGDDLTTDTAPLVIGRRGDNNFPFHGTIDEVSLYGTDLSAADVAVLYNTAPRFRMYLDEASGATQFVDAAGGRTGTCTGSACPTGGVKGQVGLAANFDGIDDAITFPLVTTVEDDLTLSLWAKWAGGDPSRRGYQHIFFNAQDPELWSLAGFDLVINQSGQLIFECYDEGGWIRPDTQLPTDVWQHVAVVVENNKARLYLNGAEQAVQRSSSNTCILTPPNPAHANTIIGRSPRQPYYDAAFSGRLDEVNLYERALSPTEIRAQYLHQATWIEDRQETGVVVDAQPPSSILLSDEPYRANTDAVLHVSAADAGTGIARVELGVNGAWYDAPACRDAAVSESGASAWCPTFDPTRLSGEGRYTLQTRAIDQVGHVETPTRTVTFYVDGTAPQFSTAIPQGTVLAPTPHPSTADAWVVALSGSVNDPALSSGDPGSGVAEVEVLLSDPAGAPVGAGTQVAAVNGTTWSVDYVFLDAEPTGHYTLTVTAVDHVGNASTRSLVSFYVDTSAPGALLDTTSLPPHTLSDDRPPDAVPGLVLHLPFDEAAGATTFVDSAAYEDGVGGNHASCTVCPTAGVDGQYGGALQFDSSQYVTVPDASALRTPQFTLSAWFQWDDVGTSEVQFLTGKGYEAFEIHTGGGAGTNGIRVIPAGFAATGVDVPDFIQTGWNHIAVVYTGSEVRVYRNGTLVGSKGGLSGADLSANTASLTIGRRGDGSYAFDGRIDDVRLYNRALPADQIAFMSRQRPFDGAVLRLALNEASGATAFANSAPGASNDGSCAGNTCPTAGADGQYAAAAQFDGVDDYVSVPDAPALRTPQFTLSAWFQWDDVDTANVQVLTSKGYEAFEILTGGGAGTNGLSFIPAGHPATSFDAPNVIQPGWNHVAVVYTGSAAYIYHNGTLAASRTGINGGTDLTANSAPLSIGRRGDGTLHFDGQIDEVRLFNRALSAAEVARLSEQLHGLVSEQPALPDTLLYLALEEPSGATAFDDSSANGHRGTCAGTACPTAGVSGQYGSAVQFDGADDAIVLPDVGRPDALAVSMWVNVAALPTAGNLASLIHHDGWNADGYVHASLRDDGRLSFAISGNAPDTQTSNFAFGAQDLNRWVHLVAIYDSAAKRFALYVDGQLDVEGTYTTAHVPILGPAQLGNWDSGACGLNGRVDEVRVYGRTLTADEAARLAQAKSSGLSQVEIAFIPTLPGSPFFNETLAGQVVYLPLEDQANASGSANVFRNVANTGKNGSCTGDTCPTTGAPGRVGNAVTFDGADDAIIVAQAIPDQYTLAAWVKFEGSKWMGFHTIMEFDNDAPWFGVDQGGELGLHPAIEGGAMPIGQWTHVAYTWDGGHGRLYINGAQVVENTSAPSDYGVELGIGRHSGDTPWQGSIDDVRVLDRALTADEITSLYLGSGPRLHLSFDDADARGGATLTDDSGWEHHGTLSTGAQDAALKSTPGHVGNGAITLDGSGDTITVTNPCLGQTFTIGGWANVRSSAQWRHVIEYGALEHGANAAFRLAVGNQGELSIAIGDGASAAETTLNTGWQYGQWVHWAVTYDGATARVYQNGSPVGTLAANKTIAGGAGTFILGSYQGSDRYLDGQIDDVFVYPRVLPALEIDALYRRAWQTATLAYSGAGVELTSWSGTTPEGLEGAYRVDLRGQDTLGNVDRSTGSTDVWHGSVDTLAPRVITITRAYLGRDSTAKTSCTLTAQDFDLSEQSVRFEPPCDVQITNRQFYRSPWYMAAAGPGADDKLYELTAVCELAGHQTGDIQATACDVAGNCAVASAPASTPPPITLDMSILTPTHNTALSTTAPIAIAGGAYALDGLRALTVTVDGTPVYTPTYGGITNTIWNTTWTPPAIDGPCVIQATVSDQNGAIYAAPPITVVLTLASPSISIASTVLTTTHYDSSGVLKLTGLFTATGGNIEYVQARIAQIGEWASGKVDGNTWTVPWTIGTQNRPDGTTYTVTAEVMDATWRAAQAIKPIKVDIAPPAPVTITVHSGGSSVAPETTLREISPTLTITWTAGSDGSGVAGYQLYWIVSRGGEYITTTISTHTPGNRQLSRTAGEAQAITLRLVTWDVYGNQTWQTFGTIYVDAPATPVYVAPQPATSQSSSYQDWTESGCSKLGVDARIRDKAQGGASLSAAQEFYVSWDAEAINMTWVGADWDADGDLFIYLDTAPGGSSLAYDPYVYWSDETKLTFPVNRNPTLLRTLQQEEGPRAALRATAATTQAMQADYAIWALYNEYALLLAWNPDTQEWKEVSDSWSGNWTYNLNWNADPYRTEIQIPFATLNITNPTSTALSLVAFASEDYSLSLWATMPPRNPVNSTRLVGHVPPTNMHNFALTQRYQWSSLGSGICPNGQDVNLLIQRISQLTGYHVTNLPAIQAAMAEIQYTGADVELGLEADPTGIAYSVLSDDYFFLMDDLDTFEDWADWDVLDDEYCEEFPEDPECERDAGGKTDPQLRGPAADDGMDLDAGQELDAVLDVDHPAVGDGQVVTYTLHYANHGEGAATGLTADIITWGPILLLDGDYYEDETGEYFNLVLDLGDLGPGAEGSTVFTGVVDLTFDVENNEGWATLDIIFYDDTGAWYEDQLDWFYVDHEIDDAPPEVQIAERPALLGPGENIVHGIGFDRSPVPTITLDVEDPWGDTDTVVCVDETPDDGEWACAFDVGAAEEGDEYYLTAYGTDVFGQEGEWSAWQGFTVDATPPTVTLGFATDNALGDGVVGPDEVLLSGDLADNYLVDAVEVCDADDVCEYANLTLDPTTIPTTVYTYDDAPAAPLPINASTDCEFGDPIVRTFSVADDFSVAEVAVGINISHAFRYDVSALLIAPSGEWAEILWDGSDAENYDVLLHDSAAVANVDDWDDHDPDEPYYENERRPDDALAIFYGEQAQGVWRLEICDYFPDEDDGAYNHSRLILTADTLPENTRAAWAYTLPDVGGLDGVTRTLDVYGWDSVGNVSDPLALAFRVDTVAPVITVTHVATEVIRVYTVTVLSGEVSDGGEVEGVFLSGYTPSGDYFITPGTAAGEGWRCDLQPGDAGEYTLWVEAVDEAGNGRSVGPFTITVLAPPLLEKRVSAVYDVLLGSTVTYTLTLYNENDVSMHGVVITDRLPSEVHFITQTAGTLLLPPVDDVLTWGPYSVAAGGVFSLTFSAVVTDDLAYYGAVVTNTAYATSADFGSSSAQAVLTIQREPMPVLSIAKSVAAAHTPVLLGDAITYTVAVANSGNADAMGVTVTDALPEGVSGNDLSWTGVVTAGEQVAFTIPAVVTTSEDYYGHTITNTARYSSTNAGSGSDEGAFTIVSAPTPLLSIVKSVATAHTPVLLGDPIIYTVVVANSGNADATNVAVTDALPDGVSGNDLSWTGVVTAGGQMAFTIPAVVTTSESYYGGTITNTAQYSSTNAGSGFDEAIFTIESQETMYVYLPLVLRSH